MFNSIPNEILDRMHYLESIDARDRTDGTPRMQRLRQIPPETGKFLALTAATAPEGQYIEIGTSAGYSTLWIALACRARKRKLTTFESMKEKIEPARETIKLAQVEDIVELVTDNAVDSLDKLKNISFCFLDAEKEDYQLLYEKVIPNMVSGGLLVADNVISHGEALKPFLEIVSSDRRVDSIIIPIGKGELVCRRI